MGGGLGRFLGLFAYRNARFWKDSSNLRGFIKVLVDFQLGAPPMPPTLKLIALLHFMVVWGSGSGFIGSAAQNHAKSHLSEAPELKREAHSGQCSC